MYTYTFVLPENHNYNEKQFIGWSFWIVELCGDRKKHRFFPHRMYNSRERTLTLITTKQLVRVESEQDGDWLQRVAPIPSKHFCRNKFMDSNNGNGN
jgi:hypothetical protein